MKCWIRLEPFEFFFSFLPTYLFLFTRREWKLSLLLSVNYECHPGCHNTCAHREWGHKKVFSLPRPLRPDPQPSTKPRHTARATFNSKLVPFSPCCALFTPRYFGCFNPAMAASFAKQQCWCLCRCLPLSRASTLTHTVANNYVLLSASWNHTKTRS